ncbi:hypothetical protein [Shewanella cyperi]|uniref:hypothetical protein n=1 Tax=Shewanella cyperi TaxID=2814292 RepID=UPI001A94B6D5|nr:hypothetical protein [Shewanella cyperi]QSX40484.1 hypothetical protein JYB84_16240 [Shewanella cyperi]
MPIGEIAGELLGGVFRILGHFLIEIVLEVLIKGLGYLICRPFSKSISPDGILVIVVGLLAWAAIGVGILITFSHFHSMETGVGINA